MRILVVCATGAIGRAVVTALSTGNEIVGVTRKTAAVRVDLADRNSVREMYHSVGKVDAVACAVGRELCVVRQPLGRFV
jgi:nucleoside-diphosphate-sugar epimerase